MRRCYSLVFLVCSMSFLIGCGSSNPTSPTASPSQAAAPTQPATIVLAVGEAPKDFPGLHNVIRVSDKLLSGSSPEGDEGFKSLQNLGVRTIISVDGARPEADRARKFEQRYVHLPISYDGVPRATALRIARAVRDLPGLVYIHCHHGKHRSPAAGAVVARCLDGKCTADQMTAMLKQAGTNPNYKGLYAAVQEISAVSPEELDKVPADFPEAAPTSSFVKLMVDVDEHWDHLKLIRTAGWQTPPKHSDLNPPHEAKLLREAYEASAQLPETKSASAEMHQWLVESAKNAQALEEVLRTGKTTGKLDTAAAEAAYKRSAADCTRCHAKYRDAPKK